MCGISKYLKEKNSDIITVGIDSYGSVFKKYKETGEFDENEIYPYMVEGIGEDILPANVDFSLIDKFIKVTDKDSAIMTRKLAREEGLFVGWSCGAAVYGALDYARENLSENDMMVILLPDHGTRYLNKIYNDDWMKDRGFTETRNYATAADIVYSKNGMDKLFTIQDGISIDEAIKILNQNGISQLPVVHENEFVGSITDSKLLHQLIANPDLKQEPVKIVMDEPLRFVAMNNTLDVLTSLIDHDHKALLVRDKKNQVHIITQHDILMAMTK